MNFVGVTVDNPRINKENKYLGITKKLIIIENQQETRNAHVRPTATSPTSLLVGMVDWAMGARKS